MSGDKSQDNKVIDLFMDDSIWLNKISKKEKYIEKEQKKEERLEERPVERLEKIVEKKQEGTEKETDSETGFGEVDYAILKSITYGFEDIRQISSALQIRTVIVEKHVFSLIKEGFLKYFQLVVLTSKGKDAILDFETNSPEDVWKPIDEFIASFKERKKERSLKIQKILDIVLLIAMIILIILIIYFGIYS